MNRHAHTLKITILNSKRVSLQTFPNAMVLEGFEAFGYEYGIILRTAFFLLVAQLFYVCTTPFINLWGSPVFWLFFMYGVASIVSLSYDIHFFNCELPKPLPQHIRFCTDVAIYFTTSEFLLMGEKGGSKEAVHLAQRYIDTLGSLLSAIFFIPALFLANCAFMAATRLIFNAMLMVAIGIRHVFVLIMGNRRDQD
ncbi:unnamed protein product [Orchesella dallaii]|uniref:Uncharacterized protein n=1 Tax=Orchesella dallaii TaxID=48710 RepID=A0ABP1QNJ5_9HEXA